jgi:hypothetical protein
MSTQKVGSHLRRRVCFARGLGPFSPPCMPNAPLAASGTRGSTLPGPSGPERVCWSRTRTGCSGARARVGDCRACIGSKGQRGHAHQRGEAISLRLGTVSRTEPSGSFCLALQKRANGGASCRKICRWGCDEPTKSVHSEDVRKACTMLAYVHEAMMPLGQFDGPCCREPQNGH